MNTHCKNVIRVVCCFISVIFSHSYLHAKSSNNYWVKTYGGAKWDEGHYVQQTSDGGYIIAGETSSYGVGHIDIYLIKVDLNGDTLWTRTYGGKSDDYAWAVQQTSDGGYIIVGVTNSFGVIFDDIYLIKTDKKGDILWTKIYGGEGINEGRAVQQVKDFGYIIVGSTRWIPDVYLIKTNKDGDTLWTNTYGGSCPDEGWSVKQTRDGNYIILGTTFSADPPCPHMYLLKVGKDGYTFWTKTYNGEGYSIQQTNDGGYVAAGRIPNPHWHGSSLRYVPYILKTDENGDTLWTRAYITKEQASARVVQQTWDNGYVVLGKIITYRDTIHAGKADRSGIYLIKTNKDGDTLWTRVYGGSCNFHPYSIQYTSDSGYIVTGLTDIHGQYDVFLFKTDKFGKCPPFDEFFKIIKKETKPDTGISTTPTVEEVPYINLDSNIYKKPKIFSTSEIARKASVEGDVVVRVLIDIDGSIMENQLMESSGNETLDEAALDIVRQSKYSPGKARHRHKRTWITRKIEFRFDE